MLILIARFRIKPGYREKMISTERIQSPECNHIGQ